MNTFKLALEFAKLISEALTPEQLETVNLRNETRERNVCHSHDFCDIVTK